MYGRKFTGGIMENVENHRNEQRRHLIYYLNVENRKTGESVGRVVDITGGGILVISNKTIASDEEISVKIELGDELLEKVHGHLEVDLVSRWSKPDVNPNYFVTGFSFTHVTEDQESIIDRIIKTIGFRDLD
jgi:hypothetical protein